MPTLVQGAVPKLLQSQHSFKAIHIMTEGQLLEGHMLCSTRQVLLYGHLHSHCKSPLPAGPPQAKHTHAFTS
jgi:hypothetical protein